MAYQVAAFRRGVNSCVIALQEQGATCPSHVRDKRLRKARKNARKKSGQAPDGTRMAVPLHETAARGLMGKNTPGGIPT